MSFNRFLADLKDIEEELVERQISERNGIITYEPFDEKRLDDLLDDLTDFSRSHGNGPLTSKLASLVKDESFNLVSQNNFAEIRARALRIIRVVETFGQKFLELDVKNTAGAPSLGNPIPQSSVAEMESSAKKVFVVHGHENSVLFRVKETLIALGLKPIVLREQPNGGRTIIEKFESYADVGFAVVLMTADDMGGSLAEFENGQASPRARQNVVMELGYFSSKLSRGKICVLKAESVEAPSDILGVIYTSIDDAEAWRLSLAKELKNAGYDIDLNLLG